MPKMTWDARAAFLRLMDPGRFEKLADMRMSTIRRDCVPEQSSSYKGCVVIGVEPTYENRRSITLAVRKLNRRT